MAAVSGERHPRIVTVSETARVTPIELFFDLVFVFAITQVSALMAADPTGRGLLRGMLVLALVWWCWVGFAWLGSILRADEGLGRVAIFGAMAATFVMALCVPEAFDDLPGGLDGPVVIAFAYLGVRLLHLAIFWLAADEDPGLRRQLVRFAPSLAGGTVLLLVASQLEGTAQTLAWIGALVADYVGTILGGASGWRLNAPGLFAERHGLIVIIALGESVIAIGVGVARMPISWPIVAASVLGLTLTASLWWAYFDVVALIAERNLRRATGEERTRMARDAYSYLHLPLIGGIVLVAVGLEEVLAFVGGAHDHALEDPLPMFQLSAMFAGVALFLLAHVAFTYRAEGMVKVQRVITAFVIVLLIPPAASLPALGALALLTAVMVLMVGVESVRFAEARERVRHEDDA
jgi:low temperature requirement protein LtrA